MNKNINMPVILLEELTMDRLLSAFGVGNEIVFVVEDGKLFGGITQGDFKRALRKGTDVLMSQIVNREIKRITLSECADGLKGGECEAQRLFNEYIRINAIPVVDDEGVLCFQFERKKNRVKNQIINLLNISDSGDIFEAFIRCYADMNIVITGADDECLARAVKLFEKRVKKFNEKAVISVQSLKDCSFLESDSVVITLTDFCTLYLKEYAACGAAVVPLELLPAYEVFLKMNTFSIETLLTWKQVFGYEEAELIEENPYTCHLKVLMEQCGIHFKSLPDEDRDLFCRQNSGIPLILYSDCGKFRETISIGRLVEIIQLIKDYRDVSRQSYSSDIFIRDFRECFSSLLKQGAGKIYYEEFNKLDVKVKEEIVSIEKSLIHYKERHINGKCINVKDVRSIMCKEISYNFDFIYECIQYSINKVIYNKLTGMCRKVYRLNNRSLNELNYPDYPERSRINFLKEGSGMFPENFVEDLYGDKEYPVKELLKDIAGCKMDEICKGYIKYQSNYSSKHFNTDMYGSRITTDTPEEYKGTIYLLGRCIMSGYAVCDHDTTASYLQRLLNKNDYSYRVVNLAIDNGEYQYIYKKIMERDIKGSDIIVMQFPWADVEASNTIYFDYKNVAGQISDTSQEEKSFYWDVNCHCSKKGYEMIADCIYGHVKYDLMQGGIYQFRLDKELEKKIEDYLEKSRDRICSCNSIKQGEKVGAIVMNCNPFTYGHLYLVETASRLVDTLYIFVVQEDKSVFSFKERLKMVQDGVKGLDNVIVLSGGDFMISTVTFPGYFMKEDPTNTCYDSYLDLKIFLHYIVPAFHISVRFVGTEPFDQVTAKYNHDIQSTLGRGRVQVDPVPTKKWGAGFISATVVRKLLKERKWDELRSFVPDSTYQIVRDGIEQ